MKRRRFEAKFFLSHADCDHFCEPADGTRTVIQITRIVEYSVSVLHNALDTWPTFLTVRTSRPSTGSEVARDKQRHCAIFRCHGVSTLQAIVQLIAYIMLVFSPCQAHAFGS